MCGIAGIFHLAGERLPDFSADLVLDRLSHRGPDGRGAFVQDGLFLGATRLAIVDPPGGHQPMASEDGRFHIVMNGEVFDHDHLRGWLEGRGHNFRSRCDTEVALHLTEDLWDAALDRMDGQFALAVHDSAERRLLLARDRMGICPLFYALVGDYLIFASEMKAIFATGLLAPSVDPRALDAVLAVGTVPAPLAAFEGVRCLPPGHWLEAGPRGVAVHRYWDIPYPDAGAYPVRDDREWERLLHDALKRSCERRLRADVAVGLYLSGGVDSASVAALVSQARDVAGRAFSIRFPEPGFDESQRTQDVADRLGIHVEFLTYSQDALARDMPTLVYHSETPQISTESVPLLALSRLAARSVKVVLTGEGSDEALGGYPYFIWEAMQQWAGRHTAGRLVVGAAHAWFRHALGRENPCDPPADDVAWANEVFGCYPAVMGRYFYFRRLREMVCSDAMRDRQRRLSDADLVQLPVDAMRRWDPINRSLYVDSRIGLSSHLLAAHGDRALMAHSIEGRYPFLDRDVQELLASAPPDVKCRWHAGKRLLRRAMREHLPRDVRRRPKKPFLAPFGTPFVGPDAPEYVRDLLSPGALAKYGYFDAGKVAGIVAELELIKTRLIADPRGSLRFDPAVVRRTMLGMALTFVVTTQILADQVEAGMFGARTAA